MSDKKRPSRNETARRTSGEGVPKTKRPGPETAQAKAAPRRVQRPAVARINVRKPTARDRQGL